MKGTRVSAQSRRSERIMSAPIESGSRDIRGCMSRLPAGCGYVILTASAEAVPTAATAAAARLPGAKAILAIHGTVASRFERNGGLLAAAGTDHAGAL